MLDSSEGSAHPVHDGVLAIGGGSPCWDHPGRLWSLLDMLRFYAAAWTRLILDLQDLELSIINHPPEGRNNPVTKQEDVLLKRVRTACALMGAGVSVKQVDALLGAVDKQQITNIEFCRAAGVLKQTVMYETESFAYFYLEKEKAKYLDLKSPFGESVTAAFPQAVIDIEEAGNCLALGRNTACVLHLMRAMESVVHAVAKSIGVNYEFRGWEAVIKKMRSELEKEYDKMEPTFVGKKEFYSNVLDRLLATKDAIRNPSMHGRINYDAERAEEVYRSTKALIQKVAEGLTEPTEETDV
jgi:hypothetical protein